MKSWWTVILQWRRGDKHKWVWRGTEQMCLGCLKEVLQPISTRTSYWTSTFNLRILGGTPFCLEESKLRRWELTRLIFLLSLFQDSKKSVYLVYHREWAGYLLSKAASFIKLGLCWNSHWVLNGGLHLFSTEFPTMVAEPANRNHQAARWQGQRPLQTYLLPLVEAELCHAWSVEQGMSVGSDLCPCLVVFMHRVLLCTTLCCDSQKIQ